MPSFLHVVGARPNFVKAAPVWRALARRGAEQRLCHTGQHYDASLAADVERDVGLPQPDLRLGVGSGSHAEQTAAVMVGVERACCEIQPDVVVVYGDVNSTLGAALGAAKASAAIAHVEAGLRSGDRTMPEEINRRLVDHLSDVLFATDELAAANLRAEGLGDRAVHVVGNVMADSLLSALAVVPVEPGAHLRHRLDVASAEYAIVTLHRPESLDRPAVLDELLAAVLHLSTRLSVVFPQHPRTCARLGDTGHAAALRRAGVKLVPPLGHRDMALLLATARIVVTDSGGLQDESAVLGVPCVTARTTTERPATVACGSNRVAGTSCAGIVSAIDDALRGPPRIEARPPLWDGRTAERIAEVLVSRRRP